MMKRLVLTVVTLIVSTGMVLAAPRLEALSPQFQVNAYTTGFQRSARIIGAGGGQFRVIWQSTRAGGEDGPNGFLLTRRFAAHGVPESDEIRLDDSDLQPEVAPAAAKRSDHGFVLTWSDGAAAFLETFPDEPEGDVFGRVFDADAAPLGASFQLNEFTTGRQLLPSVAVLDDDSFVVSWTDLESQQIRARHYVAPDDGGGSFEVTSSDWLRRFPAYSEAIPADDGDFRVIWQRSYCYLICVGAIESRRFSSAGEPQGALMEEPAVFGFRPDSKPRPQGGWVVAWPEFYLGYAYGPSNVRMRSFDAEAVGAPPILVQSTEPASPIDVAVETDPHDRFVVAWSDYRPATRDADGRGIIGQALDASGRRLGGHFQINAYESGRQFEPELLRTGDDTFVATWTSRGSPTDDFGDSIQGRMLILADAIFRDGFEDGGTDAWAVASP